MMVYDGTVSTKPHASDSLLLGGQALAYVLSRVNHTNQQTASTISDLATVVKAYRLDEFVAPNVDLPIGSHKITGLSDGTAPTDAATKGQMDAAIATASAGLSWKQPVRFATTANINLATTGLTAIDGVTPVAGDRVLVKNQTLGQANGIYIAAVGSWAAARSTDADSSAELQGGVLVPVDEGTVNADTVWMLSGDIATVGTTVQTWTQFGAGAAYTASGGVTLTGTNFTANVGTGMLVTSNQIVPDFGSGANKVMRAKIAVGYVGTTGQDVTINHALALAVKEDFIAEFFEVGVGKVLVGVSATDANNIVASFQTTPTTNQYRYQILGLS
jgi:hypothetical protein